MKTLRQLPNYVYGLAPLESSGPWFCPVPLMEEYVDYGFSIGVNMSFGYLYATIDEHRVRSEVQLSTVFINSRLRFYLDRAGLDTSNQGDLILSIHYLRAGSAIF